MKRLWIAFLILAAVTALCIGSLFSLRSTIATLREQLTAAETAVKAGDLEDAMVKTRAFRAGCEKADDTFDVLSRHEQTLPLQQSSYRLLTLLEQQAVEEYLLEAAQCRFYLEELLAEEEPLFGNVF